MGTTADVERSGQSAGERKRSRGFAAMDRQKQREIASKGGKAAHQKGTAHEFDTEQARRAGQKGGEVVSRNREHMSSIGRKGGESVSSNREHMSRIGRKGGETVSSDREHMSLIGRKGGESVSTDRGHMSQIGREGGTSRGSRSMGEGDHGFMNGQDAENRPDEQQEKPGPHDGAHSSH